MPSSRYYKFKEVSRKERIKKLKNLFLFIVISGLFLGIIWMIFLSPFFKIKKINIVSENAYLNRDDIMKIISETAPLGFRENLLLVSKFRLKKELTAAFPAIKDITIKKSLFHTLMVDFRQRIPVGIWCYPAGGQPQADNCYYFDSEGIAFAYAPQTEGGLILKITDLSKNDISLGNKVLDNGRINFVMDFMDKIDKINTFRILEFKVIPSSSVDFEAVTDNGWSIYLDDKQEPASAVNNLMIVLDEAIKNTGNLEYIDLRIPSRIFYKLK